MEFILKHELMHYKRSDMIYNILLLITGFNNKKILKGRLENMLNMKEKKRGIILAVLIVVITVISLVGFNIVFKKDMNKSSNIITAKGQLLQPEQVIKNYFGYYNEKNVKGVNSTHTEWLRGPSLDENLKSIKLNSIVEDTSPSEKEGYMKYGRGIINGAKAENVKIYKVNYTVKYKKDGIGPEDSGTYEKWIILVRKDKNSPWLIDDGGEG
ncbi:DUF4829 domain-containing protein [Clostridium aromativorans]|nr:DUF4829 domain-containing protein [Clostridium aromativorans]